MENDNYIESKCPECNKCNTRSLILREKDIYCNHCEKVILTEIPKTPEGKQEALRALEKYIRELMKNKT